MTKHRVTTTYHKGENFAAIGNTSLLKNDLTGFLCSRKCPASKILEAHETCKAWASDPTKTVISGFHSPVEQECLRLLLQGQANIIYFPAREIEHLRIRKEWRPALKENRMLIITLESFKNRRMSRTETELRNNLIAELAKSVYIPYAAKDGQLERLSFEVCPGPVHVDKVVV